MLVNTHEIEIEWGDCDAAGIVFYPRYFSYFDACTGRLFEKALGMKKIAWVQKFGIVGIPMVDTGARFVVPSRYGDVVTVESRMTACRRASFDIEHRLLKDGELAVEGRETRVWTGRDPENPERLKAATIPDEVLTAFGIERG